jgi:two-component system CheB/CheR fusion protein
VIVLTQDLGVQIWSPGAEEMWGLRADEAVGKSLLALDIGLPSDVIAPRLRGLLNRPGNGTSAVDLAAVNRRGKTVDLHIAASPLRTEEAWSAASSW